jgi:predicted ATPase
MVGRSAELPVLTGLLGQAAASRGNLAVLVGEAGVGKSRLVRELVEVAVDRDCLC